MRQLTWCVLVVAMAPFVCRCAAAQSPVFEPPGLRAYLREVLTQNAAYQAAGSRLAAASREIPPAGALPDPMLTVGMMSVPAPSFDFRAEAMTQAPTVMLVQQFPFPGKQGASTAVARADSAVADRSAGGVRAGLAAAAARAYYELAYAHTALAVWRRRAELADQAVRVSQARYQTGAAPQTDMLRAQLRRSELEERHHQLEADLAAALAGVDALRGGRGDSVPAPLLVTPDGRSVLDVRADSLSVDSLLEGQLLQYSPALRTAAAEVEQADAQAHRFGIAARPDFSLSLQYGRRFAGREPFVTAQLGLSIPVWAGRKQGPAARAAELEALGARQRHDDLLARAQAELRTALAVLTALQGRVAQLSDQILPLAEATTASALQRYEVGAVEFTTVLDVQDELFTDQLRLARLVADYGSERARLAALVGEEWY